MDDAEVIGSIDRVLQGSDKGFSNFDQTFANLKIVLVKLDEGQRSKCLDHLFQLLVDKIRDTPAADSTRLERQRRSIGILFKVLFESGRGEVTLCSIVGFLDANNPNTVENWRKCVGPEIINAVSKNSGDINQGCLDVLKGHLALFPDPFSPHPQSNLSRAMPALLSYVAELKRAIEKAEFTRFERQLRSAIQVAPTPKVTEEKSELAALNPNIEEALKEAGEYLRGGETFGPKKFNSKKAADLLRSCLDEAHREIVKRLVEKTGSPYAGGEKDGSRRQYFRNVGFISEPEEKFFSAIYTLLSEEATHKLIAPRETVLVMGQTVQSYLLLLVRRLSSFSPQKPGATP